MKDLINGEIRGGMVLQEKEAKRMAMEVGRKDSPEIVKRKNGKEARCE